MKSMHWGRTTLLVAVVVSSPAYGADATVEAKGIRNFHQVNEHIFRGAQPAQEGWNSLAKLGVKLVIDLRREGENGHSIASEAKAVEAAGMRYINIPMNGIVSPREADIRKALDLLDGPDPVFVHCKLGKDRTGTVVACYRIAHDRWDNGKALAEAKTVGMHSIEFGMKRYISSFRGAPVTDAATPVD